MSVVEDEFWDDVVGRWEIAKRCGVDRAAVNNWSHRDPTFPKARKRLHGTLLWSWRDVQQWLREREQRRVGSGTP
jgi:predicted DNA-binding transcriptional regulator AlpA